jgi:hypothetical protein
VNAGHLSNWHNNLYYIRHLILYEFLKTRSSLFDRIISVDLFDTIFQGDPFYKGFNRYAMSFATETGFLGWNQLESVVKVAGKQYENELKTYQTINAGLAMGEVRVFLTFFTLYAELLLTFPFDELFTLVYTDQDVINALIRGNKSRDAGIPTMLYGDSGPIHVLWR